MDVGPAPEKHGVVFVFPIMGAHVPNRMQRLPVIPEDAVEDSLVSVWRTITRGFVASADQGHEPLKCARVRAQYHEAGIEVAAAPVYSSQTAAQNHVHELVGDIL
eukprot:CAMPEP_0181195246 /NCGR_PEP_ID=MMETSP1096-20121128/14777_1 /TAXON_ID=156174 ORGANISM="Chrysochromulina ericina, Strain CCMP281" /NCGR_SAMPLE_ID=MMETSP1096 /ASSEMBLY_ACC=CAM_ASM_000453 /LENGTH=104 /DNA_ID=CAMNT_0023284821 /DNA_START=1582 /DNA_END=1896 /DNA_ORIENTATION=+